jgi:hypothetical protein
VILAGLALLACRTATPAADTATTPTASTPPTAEDCANDRDDDQDGLGDCADPDCACDADGDGWLATSAGGADCADEDAGVYPDAPERCDGRDQDCDDAIDEPEDLAPDEGVETWIDADQDGWGGTRGWRCAPEASVGGDPDDGDPTVVPGGAHLLPNGDGWIDLAQPEGRIYADGEAIGGGWAVGDLTGDGAADALLQRTDGMGVAPGPLLGERPSTLPGPAVAGPALRWAGEPTADGAVLLWGDAGVGLVDPAQDPAWDAGRWWVDGAFDGVGVAARGPEPAWAVLSVGADLTAWPVDAAGAQGAPTARWTAEAGCAGVPWALADLDGDGWSDAVFGCPGSAVGAGWVRVFPGPIPDGARAEDAPTTVFAAADDAAFGVALADAGDLSGDGRRAIAIATGSGWTLFTAPGPGDLTADHATATLALPAGAVVALPDVDGDGRDELAWGDPAADALLPGTGVVRIFAGPLAGTVESGAAVVSIGSSQLGDVGLTVGQPGRDVDGDGRGDLPLAFTAAAPGAGGALAIVYGADWGN